MDDFITARRKDDAVVSVCQDNKKKNVLILGLNQAARNLLKYEEGDLLNKPLVSTSTLLANIVFATSIFPSILPFSLPIWMPSLSFCLRACLQTE